MSNIAIRVEGLGKMYRIGGKQERYRTLRDTLTDAFAAPFRRASSLLRGQAYGAADLKETIWALKDVSFEVKHGEVVGIIGRNGAGKSTLLKILSRITEPTEGYADVYGRVGSLLEVGTGFHPELTGRENIYLNGAILGMSRAEIDRKFDEIVAFAEIEKFIDTPVKHYSSGMGLRLGFAVAAHLEPEILVVDEVLAVGDAQFQKKCLGKMGEVAGEGRTVLFVSHNMGAVQHLCEKTAVLESGILSLYGDTSQAVHYYLGGNRSESIGALADVRDYADRSGIGGARILAIQIRDRVGLSRTNFGIGEPFQISIELELSGDVSNLVAGLEIKSIEGIPILNLRSDSQGIIFRFAPTHNRLKIHVNIPGLPLYPGLYIVEPWVAQYLGSRMDHVHDALRISLEPMGFLTSEKLIQPGRGVLLLDCAWDISAVMNEDNPEESYRV